MSLDATALNLAADAVGATALRAALHTDDPGAGAANELSGGGYARQAIAWDAASGGIAASADPVEFDVPAVTITWVSLWSADGLTRYGKAELAAPAEFPVAGIFRLLTASLTFA